MANHKADWLQRQELHHILHWVNSPVKTPFEYMVKFSVKCFLNGVDPEAELINQGVEAFQARRANEKARVWIGNERAKRRSRGAEIRAQRETRVKPVFTSENFSVTMDNSQHRNYGMVDISIHCTVEIWTDDNDLEAEKEYLINFSDYKTKEWLIRLMVWAFMNKREVLMKPATEHEMTSMRVFIPRDKVP